MTQAMNLANFSNSLDSSGGVPPSQLNAPVTIAKGGTNASTIAGARTSLSVYSNAETDTAIAASNPTGSINLWPLSTAPAGHLLCDGTSYSTTTYAALFSVLGYVYGGSGASFNVPDFRDRMPVGAGTTYAANASGGSANAVVVSHTHTATITDPTHSHTATVNVGGGGGASAVFGAQAGGPASSSTATTNSASTGISVTNASTGVSATNANLPPYRGIYFMIKT